MGFVVPEEKMFEYVDNTHIHTYKWTTEVYLYFKLTNEPKGSGELKNLYEVWFYTIFFSYFIHVYSPRARADNAVGTKFWCQQKCLITLRFCCKLKKSLWNLILYIFFMLLHVYSSRAGADNPLGTKFWCQQKGLITLPICCMFQKQSLWSLILYFFFKWFSTCI